MEIKKYYDSNSERIIHEEYYLNDELVRNIYYYNDFGIKNDTYYKNDHYHNDDNDKPAFVMYFPNGLIELERYYKNGKLHRDDDKPAVIEYYKNGLLKREIYYIEGRVKRLGLNIFKLNQKHLQYLQFVYSNSSLEERQNLNFKYLCKDYLHPTIIEYSENEDYIIKKYTNTRGIPIETLKEECIIPLTKSATKI